MKAKEMLEKSNNPLIVIGVLNSMYSYNDIGIEEYIENMDFILPKAKQYIQDYKDGKFNKEV